MKRATKIENVSAKRTVTSALQEVCIPDLSINSFIKPQSVAHRTFFCFLAPHRVTILIAIIEIFRCGCTKKYYCSSVLVQRGWPEPRYCICKCGSQFLIRRNLNFCCFLDLHRQENFFWKGVEDDYAHCAVVIFESNSEHKCCFSLRTLLLRRNPLFHLHGKELISVLE